MNVTTLNRFKGTQLIDKITSTYNANSNQLNYLQDAEPAYNIGNQSSNNYKYNAIGALIQDNELGINTITWNRFNKPQSVQQGNKKYHYSYSPLGYKLVEKAAKYSNYYVYDATGNVQAQYRISGDSLFLSHHVLYGAKRLGLVASSFFVATKPNRAIFGPDNLTITSIPLSRFNHRRPLGRYYTLELGNKQYELTNHLGNVQAVISDRKLPVLKNGFIAKYQADLQSSKEYYPFGMVLYDSSLVSYNYGFNGKPHDFGISSWQDYGFRFYDTRFPRFLSVDPLAGKYPSMAPYVPFANNPILFVDPDGREIRIMNLDAINLFNSTQLSVFGTDKIFKVGDNGRVKINERQLRKFLKTANSDQKDILDALKKTIKSEKTIVTYVFNSSLDAELNKIQKNAITLPEENGMKAYTIPEINLGDRAAGFAFFEKNQAKKINLEGLEKFGFIKIDIEKLNKLTAERNDENCTMQKLDIKSSFFHELLDHGFKWINNENPDLKHQDKSQEVEFQNKTIRQINQNDNSNIYERTGSDH